MCAKGLREMIVNLESVAQRSGHLYKVDSNRKKRGPNSLETEPLNNFIWPNRPGIL